MYYVYVLENPEGRHYIGYSSDLDKRLKRHNQNSVRSTKRKGPFRIIYKEEFATATEARSRETQLKNCKSNTVIKKLLGESMTLSSSLV